MIALHIHHPAAAGPFGRGARGLSVWLSLLAALWLGPTAPAHAHDFRKGDIVVEHPYALPSPAGGGETLVHLKSVRNRGREGDRLVGARTAVASSVQIRRAGTAGSAPTESIELPAGATVSLRHDGPWRLALQGVRTPLAPGEHFDLTLDFARAGPLTVRVDVQTPRPAKHMH